MISITLPNPPATNRLWRKWRGVMVVSNEAREFKRQVALLCRAHRLKPLSGPVAVHMVWFRPRKTGDLDGRIKITLDALNGLAYADDRDVVHLVADRREDKHNPRIEVTISPAGGQQQ